MSKVNIIRELKLYYENEAKINCSSERFLIAFEYQIRAKECDIILHKFDIHDRILREKEETKNN